MNNYLLVVCGHEGIDSIIGLYDKETATQKLIALRKKPHDKWTKPDQYCVHFVNEKGAKCVCSKLKCPPSKLWLM